MDKFTKERYILLAEFLTKTLGPEYEIVLHDFSKGEHSIAYIANGHISGRDKDSGLSKRFFSYIDEDTVANNDYVVSNKGIVLKNKLNRTSTLFIKDEDNNLTGMLCISFDGSKYVNLAKNILQLTYMENASIENERLHNFDFIDDINYVISSVTDKAMDNTLEFANIPVERLTQEEKIDIVRELYEKGVFMIKGAVSDVAEKLSVSEATLYRYIRMVTKKSKVSSSK